MFIGINGSVVCPAESISPVPMTATTIAQHRNALIDTVSLSISLLEQQNANVKRKLILMRYSIKINTLERHNTKKP